MPVHPILADMGLPMVALYLPPAWLALVPIILIESWYGSRQYKLPFGRTVFAQATANSVSTLLGIPITWGLVVLLQFVAVPSGTGPAWLLPDSPSATVIAATGALTIVFYFMSVVTEGAIVRRFFHEVPPKMIRRWVVQANAVTYALLFALVIGVELAPSGPFVRFMEPVDEVMIGGVFWLVDQVSGKHKKEPGLIEAVEVGDLKKAQKLLASGANANQTNRSGFPALSRAASRGDEKMTKLLLEAGADANAHSATLSDTPLARAAQYGNAATVRVLLGAGANKDARDGSGWTPLFNASMMGNLEIVEALLAAGADANARSSTGWTALKEAQMRGQNAIVERLKRAGATDFADGTR